MSAEETFALACAAYVDVVPQDEQPVAEKHSSRRPAKSSSRPTDVAHKQWDRAFLSHKQHVLSNLASNACDYSPKGGVDHKCLSLMSVLNTHADYVTTSSCSGRISLFHSIAPAARGDGAAMKRGEANALGWLFVKHGALTLSETDALVRLLCGPTASPEEHNKSTGDCSGEGELDGVWVRAGALQSADGAEVPETGCVALKVEPFVMHVACRTMESAKRLLSAAASDAGFRNSGLTPSERRTMCAIRHAAGHGMDVPLVVDGVNYAAGKHAYVRRLLEMASEKMCGNDARIQRLEECVKARLSGSK